MAPKGKKAAPPPSSSPAQTASSKPTTTTTSSPDKPPTIGTVRLAAYQQSRPALSAYEAASNNLSALSAAQKERLPYEVARETGSYRQLSAAEQKKFLAACASLKVDKPLPRPASLGTDRTGRSIDSYSVEEYGVYEEQQRELRALKEKSRVFRADYDAFRRGRGRGSGKARKVRESFYEGLSKEKAEGLRKLFAEAEESGNITEERIEEEKDRRFKMAQLLHQREPGRYSGDPVWDDVVPLPQDDGEKPLAAIAYSDDYAEAISYLRAIMASNEHSPRVLDLTAHIIDLNPAHYTVWLYRATTLFALSSSIKDELAWVNEVALENQKNYQIWHHRQLLISTLLDGPSPTADEKDVHITSRESILDLARSELLFMSMMFERDSKNYHVWSYRQWLVRRLEIFPSQVHDFAGPNEIAAVEQLLDQDVRNNSAWSHRFFVVFSDPSYSTPDSRAMERDDAIPSQIVEREIAFAQDKIRLAPQNMSSWNYLRGVLRKAGKSVTELEGFAEEFVRLGEAEEVKSSHALDLLADVWAEKGDREKAVTVLRLLADKYDRVRKNFWEWKIESLT